MHFLGLDYIISSIIWLLILFSIIFVFRERIKNYLYPQVSLDLFLTKLKLYLHENHPKIAFDFMIVEETKNEKNPDIRKFAIIGNILEQYKKHPLNPNDYPQATPPSLRWDSYVFNCEPNKDKLPPDWEKRKNALIIRDKKSCLRCGKKVTQFTIAVHLIRPVNNGGKYHLENLLSLCKDCEKILSKDPKKMANLQIKEDLEEIAIKS